MKLVARLFPVLGSLSGYCWLLTINYASAQVTQDSSLGTQVNQAANVWEITGGQQTGGNLFHSFQDFSLPTNNTAFFNNASNVANIISRVTGGSLSDIDGLIKANGAANLILINPNGINFGANARLNIGGSFLGSTASSIEFADGTRFSAIDTQTPPLLTVSVPVGLQVGQGAGAINIEGTGHNLSLEAPIFSPFTRGEVNGLEVHPNQTLALIGNGLTLDGGTLTAEGGRIELGSVTEGFVSLNETDQGLTLGYENASSFGEIELRSQALVDTSGTSSGSIQLQGRRIAVTDGSAALILNQGNQASGTLRANATETIEIIGTNADGSIPSGLFTEAISDGRGGDIAIATQQLKISDGGQVRTLTFASGDAGDLTVRAQKSVELAGRSPVDGLFPSALVAVSVAQPTSAEGNGGNLTITTPQLTIRDGAIASVSSSGFGNGGTLRIDSDSLLLERGGALEATTVSGRGGNVQINANTVLLNQGLINGSVFGDGTGGNIEIKATESIEIVGSGFTFLEDSFLSPGILNPDTFTNIDPSILVEGIVAATAGGGSAGNITIETGNLQLREGGLVVTATFSDGEAGSIFINAPESLRVDASIIAASTANAGDSGDINVNTGNLTLEAGGQVITSTLGSGDAGDLTVNASESIELSGISFDGSLPSNLAAGAQPLATVTGDGGDLTLTTPQLNIFDGAAVSVSSVGAGDGGNLLVKADSILVDNQSSITAASSSGQGGNITIKAEDVTWRRGSLTTATAGEQGNGGNIFIEADILTALEGSKIIANAVGGSGGNIQINTDGIFTCSDCVIDASSNLGVDGMVEIATLETGNNLEIVELPTETARSEDVVALSCFAQRNSNKSEFIITGRGGLPPRPTDLLNSPAIASFDAEQDKIQADARLAATKLPPPAQSWYVNAEGVVVLAAQASEATPYGFGLTSADCHDQ